MGGYLLFRRPEWKDGLKLQAQNRHRPGKEKAPQRRTEPRAGTIDTFSLSHAARSVNRFVAFGYLKSDVGFFCFTVFEKGDCSKVFCGVFSFRAVRGKAVAVKFYVGFLIKSGLCKKRHRHLTEDAGVFLLECSGNQLNNSSSFCWSVPSLAYGWMIYRESYPWGRKRRPEIKSLSLAMEQQPCHVPGPHFKTHAPGDSFSFSHPVSGTEYTLTVQELEEQAISQQQFDSNRWCYPTHFTAMSYTISPEPDDDISICDCAEGDRPLEIAPCADSYAPEARNGIVCVGVIGGTVGPAAVVFGKNAQGHLHAVCSALHFEPVAEDIEWRIEFHVVQFPRKTFLLI
mgnify:CR=1 FL=1